MSITDELREYVSNADRDVYTGKLLAIADHIDAAHERLCSRSRSNGYSDGFTDGFNDIESWVIDHEDEMAEYGWYRALDADKKPIRLGDEVYQVEGGWVYTVKSITFYPDNTTVSFSCKHGCGCDNAHNVRHYHAPTVEDVLHDFICDHEEGMRDESDLIAEYAAKLRLADDVKEQ